MALKQINLGFDAAQDRILMRISTQANREYRVWLTRRIVRALLPAIDKVMTETERRSGQVATPQAAEALSRFRHEEAVGQAQFTPGYEAAEPASELGDQPMLVSRVQLRPLDGGRFHLSLAPQQGDAIQLTLGPVLMHGTLKLLRDAVLAADWDLPDAASSTLPTAALTDSIN